MTVPRENPMRSGRSALVVVGATVVAGVGGYVITTVAARGLGTGYATFAIFWASLYLIVGTFAGVQQEVARGSRLSQSAGKIRGRAQISTVALTCGGVVGVVATVFALLSPALESSLGLPLTIGTSLSVVIAAISGFYLGVHSWNLLAIVIVSDVALRLAFVIIALDFGGSSVTLAWACVAPFPLLVVVNVLLLVRRRQIGAVLDVGHTVAWRNLSRTVLASFGAAVLVSGFPLAMSVAVSPSQASQLGSLIFALTLTRAPLVVGTLALQGYLVVYFRDAVGGVFRKLLILFLGTLIGGILLAVAALAIGREAIILLAGPLFGLDSGYLAALTLSSIPSAWLAIAGTAVLASGRHTQYTVGWLAGALAAILLLFIPGDIASQLLLALSVGPLVGLALQLIPFRKKQRKFLP